MDLEQTFLDLASFIRVTASQEEGATSSVGSAEAGCLHPLLVEKHSQVLGFIPLTRLD